MRELLNTRAAFGEEASDVPAAVSDRVVEWFPIDARCLEIGAAVDKCRRNVDVVATRGPVQRSLGGCGGSGGVRIGAGFDQSLTMAGPLGKHPGQSVTT